VIGSALGGPPLVERLRPVRRGLQLCAVVIRVSAGVVESVLRHELHDLQRALLAADVRELHVRLKGIDKTRDFAGGDSKDRRQQALFTT
jgi:predicted nucleic acid-binding Zn ribbon protein